MTKTKKYVVCAILINCVILFFVFKRYSVTPEKYSDTESYIVDIPYLQSDSIIQSIKDQYPQYRPDINDSTLGNFYTADKRGITRYSIPQIGYEVECVTLPMMDPNKTHLLLIKYRKDNTEQMHYINSSYVNQPEESQKAIEGFEAEILPKIGKWKHYHNKFLRWLDVH